MADLPSLPHDARDLLTSAVLADVLDALGHRTSTLPPELRPLRPEWRLDESNGSYGHIAIYFGSDEFTVGRPHPMIDTGLRLRRLEQEVAQLRAERDAHITSELLSLAGEPAEPVLA